MPYINCWARQAGSHSSAQWKEGRYNQFLRARHVFYWSLPPLSLFSGSSHLGGHPAPCSLVHQTAATSLLPRSLLPPAPEHSRNPWDAPWNAEPSWFLGRINMRSNLLGGHLCLVPSCYLRAVHFLWYHSLSNTKGRGSECHTKVGYKKLSKLRLLSCRFCFVFPRQICI